MIEKGYMVFRGHGPGVYKTWVECNEEVHRHSGAYFCKHKDMAYAEKVWVNIVPSMALWIHQWKVIFFGGGREV